ncbi:acyltransferase [uncultured Parabacteroides sp.]|uniref:acyltransferase family protein n=1 Tax=uncultured Parabacteroides sp. TaxID=512312 RepID=UPI002584CDF0|nr:acyltransferase [uncultured Parabacteroides sp.]
MDKPKVAHIESLRGIAILLVVVGHVIGSTPAGGMKIDYPSFWRYLYLWIDYIQMPLFTGIAGWVYAIKPAIKYKFNAFAYKKAIRLLIPMATVGTLYFIIQYLTPGTNMKGNLADIWKIYIFPYTIYWYLPSLFLIFISMYIIDKYKLCQSTKTWLVLFAATWGISLIIKIIPSDIPNLFSYKGALAQLPYFITGVGIHRFSEQLYKNKVVIYTYLILTCIGLALLQYKWYYTVNGEEISFWYKALLPLWVISALMLLLHTNRSCQFFTWLGSFAYSIYLFHGFGTSGGRIIATKLGISSSLLIFIIATVIALFLPILIEKVIDKWQPTRVLFLGKK